MRRIIAVALILYSVSAQVPAQTQPDKTSWLGWLSRMPEHGIDVSTDHWLVLSKNPTNAQVEAIAQEYAEYIDQGVLDRNLFQPGWKIQDRPVLNLHRLDLTSLSTIESRIPQYVMLKRAMAQLKEWRKQAVNWFPDDLILFDGDQHPMVNRLNKWLQDLGLADSLPEKMFTQAHKEVLTKVQLEFALGPDGRMGKLTRQALLGVTNQRIQLLKANLERMRWLPRELPYPHIRVDIAGYRVGYVTAPLVVQEHKAIIGTPNKQTPVFQDEIESITVNPTWKVPHSIAAYSLLNKEKKEPGFFRREGFRTYRSWAADAAEVPLESVNWTSVTARNFHFRLEQKPGVLNRLGRFKLNLPNDYGIYLHDTNRPELFQREARSFSSGCTRVEGIGVLTQRIAREQGVLNELNQGLTTSDTQKIRLKNSIPVYFMYFTAWPDASGRVRYRDDIYQLDKALTSWF